MRLLLGLLAGLAVAESGPTLIPGDALGSDGSCRVQLVRQSSFAACRPGVSFGCHDGSRRQIWTRNCRGTFRCDGGSKFTCGFPPGAASYNCSCAHDYDRAPLVGYCGPTIPDEGDCEAGDGGSFKLNVASSATTAEQRALRCASCAQCHYYSYSKEACWWFAECDLDRLEQQPRSFHTVAIASRPKKPGAYRKRDRHTFIDWAQQIVQHRVVSPLVVQIGANDHGYTSPGVTTTPFPR